MQAVVVVWEILLVEVAQVVGVLLELQVVQMELLEQTTLAVAVAVLQTL
jgi:hypothetical protein